jgi:hypothetical protein
MKNVLFYGASVTHQSGSSSYFDNLEKNKFNYSRMSYPSSQFYNAGFYNIPRVKTLTDFPDIIFFEWSTTGENTFDIEKLKYALNELASSKILPAFLLLPKKETYKVNRPSDDQLYSLSSEFNIPLLDLRYLLNETNCEEILRDSVHTTEVGGKLYADAINKFLECETFGSPENIVLDQVPNYSIEIFDGKVELFEGQLLTLNFDSRSEHSEVAISHTIGPYSPVIEYISDGLVIGKYSIFDPWCYYERDNFTTLVPQSIFKKLSSKSLIIKISPDSPDFSITKTGEIFTIPKRLDIKSVFTCDLRDFTYFVS